MKLTASAWTWKIYPLSSNGPDGRFVYFLTEHHPGTVIELSEISGRKGKSFRRIAEIARMWDGSEPIRKK